VDEDSIVILSTNVAPGRVVGINVKEVILVVGTVPHVDPITAAVDCFHWIAQNVAEADPIIWGVEPESTLILNQLSAQPDAISLTTIELKVNVSLA